MALPRRIQRNVHKGWRLPTETVYVGWGRKWWKSVSLRASALSGQGLGV